MKWVKDGEIQENWCFFLIKKTKTNGSSKMVQYNTGWI